MPDKRMPQLQFCAFNGHVWQGMGMSFKSEAELMKFSRAAARKMAAGWWRQDEVPGVP